MVSGRKPHIAFVLLVTCFFGCGSDEPAMSPGEIAQMERDKARQRTEAYAKYKAEIAGAAETERRITESQYVFINEHNHLDAVELDREYIHISADNTRIEFSAKSADGDISTAGFGYVAGLLTLTPVRKIKEMKVKAMTKSLWAVPSDLAGELRSETYLNVASHPHIDFQTTNVTPDTDGMDGKYTLTGDLTIMGRTNEVKIPAVYGYTEFGVTLKAEFKIDRKGFGLDSAAGDGEFGDELNVSFTIGKSGGPPE